VARLKTSHTELYGHGVEPPGNYRYPTSVKWGFDHFRGMRYFNAPDDAAAIKLVEDADIGVTRDHLQKRVAPGKWEFIISSGPEKWDRLAK
jgi:hypothetical protein